MPSFERVVLPYKQNLERIGIDMTVRTIDTAQFKRRDDEFDFDMMVDGFGQSLSPGNEQRDFWGSKSADTKGSRNVIGIRDAAIDSLVETLIGAPDRESLINVTRALDRVLLWSHFVVPQLAQQHRLRRLLEPLRPAGQGREIRARRLRHLVDRRGQGQGPGRRK